MADHSPLRDELTGEELRPHTYDGITEFDKRLPNWWLWTFYGAMIFSALYWFTWYQSEVVQSDQAATIAGMQRLEAIRMEQSGDINNDTLWQAASNTGFLEAGRVTFENLCASCHLSNLRGKDEGGTGESLADNEWLYGNDAMYVYNMVYDGSPDASSGMQAWGSQLGPNGVRQVVAYVLSHHNREAMASATPMKTAP